MCVDIPNFVDTSLQLSSSVVGASTWVTQKKDQRRSVFLFSVFRLRVPSASSFCELCVRHFVFTRDKNFSVSFHFPGTRYCIYTSIEGVTAVHVKAGTQLWSVRGLFFYCWLSLPTSRGCGPAWVGGPVVVGQIHFRNHTTAAVEGSETFWIC